MKPFESQLEYNRWAEKYQDEWEKFLNDKLICVFAFTEEEFKRKLKDEYNLEPKDIVGAGSGALSIAVAKKNPDAKVIGVDRWGKEYAAFSKALCEENAKAEGVSNVEFKQGSASSLDFEDEVFDGLVCNYVYSNISGFNKQELILESLRTVKKGGKFAIHDIMTKSKYGDIEKLVDKLRADGYDEVHLIRTDEGRFMTKFEGYFCGLRGSMLLVGTK
jgi:ubiquinone/menaquinone biosynthesis C-methylase UbiE